MVEFVATPLPHHGTDHDSKPLPSFRAFVYQHAQFSADKKSIEVAVRPRNGSAAVWSRCHLPATGYDQLAERRFEFIPLWGFFVFLLYTMRRVNCRRCGIMAVEEVPWGGDKCTLTKASKIVFVCSDMWEPYLKVIREKCSEALHILDRLAPFERRERLKWDERLR